METEVVSVSDRIAELIYSSYPKEQLRDAVRDQIIPTLIRIFYSDKTPLSPRSSKQIADTLEQFSDKLNVFKRPEKVILPVSMSNLNERATWRFLRLSFDAITTYTVAHEVKIKEMVDAIQDLTPVSLIETVRSCGSLKINCKRLTKALRMMALGKLKIGFKAIIRLQSGGDTANLEKLKRRTELLARKGASQILKLARGRMLEAFCSIREYSETSNKWYELIIKKAACNTPVNFQISLWRLLKFCKVDSKQQKPIGVSSKVLAPSTATIGSVVMDGLQGAETQKLISGLQSRLDALKANVDSEKSLPKNNTSVSDLGGSMHDSAQSPSEPQIQDKGMLFVLIDMFVTKQHSEQYQFSWKKLMEFNRSGQGEVQLPGQDEEELPEIMEEVNESRSTIRHPSDKRIVDEDSGSESQESHDKKESTPKIVVQEGENVNDQPTVSKASENKIQSPPNEKGRKKVCFADADPNEEEELKARPKKVPKSSQKELLPENKQGSLVSIGGSAGIIKTDNSIGKQEVSQVPQFEGTKHTFENSRKQMSDLNSHTELEEI